LKELQSLGLAVELLSEEEEHVTLLEELTEEVTDFDRALEELTQENVQQAGDPE
jgi:muramoyltetrapeptide carboxypeptidase LdcA involved in peptidoglycan recycling